MSTDVFSITGGDYETAGAATGRLKERLKKVGVDADAMRRAMIAAYEAEMNVVIHARQGSMTCVLQPGRIDVDVTDSGPGIPDIGRAMQEGYTTAPEKARELGFGAGMGLPNIKRNADWFRITSTPGEGTNLSFTVYFRPRDAAEQPAHSLMVRGRLCRECLACVRACPTQALRLRGGEPLLIEHLCIDCGACIRACDTGALGVVSSTGLPKPTKDTLLLLPTAFFVQFGAGVAPARVLAALKELGYGEALVAAPWQAALRKAVVDYARREARQWPVISPVCPAVVNLIEARFPALIDAVAPFASPIEAMIQAHAGRRIVAVVSCPAERTALEPACASGSVEAIAPGQLQERLRPFLANAQQGFSGKGRSRGRRVEGAAGVLLVRGISHATAALEKAEGGLLGDACVIEPYACDGGCFGSPLLGEDPFVAESRWQGVDLAGDAPARALRRKKPFQGRPGVRLHEDMSVAIEMLSRIDELVKRLPGKDCALCGAPTCLSFAEDVVLGRASEQACVQGGPSQENAR